MRLVPRLSLRWRRRCRSRVRAGRDELDDLLAASMPSRDGLQVSHEWIRILLFRFAALSSLVTLSLFVKHSDNILTLPSQKLLQPPHHRTHRLSILPVDRHHGAARRRLSWTGARRWRGERRRDFGEHFDLVDVGNRHDHCFDAAGLGVRG